jgi:hypothetical protein
MPALLSTYVALFATHYTSVLHLAVFIIAVSDVELNTGVIGAHQIAYVPTCDLPLLRPESPIMLSTEVPQLCSCGTIPSTARLKHPEVLL